MSLYTLDVSGVVRDLNANKAAWPNDLFKVVDVSAISAIAIGWTWNGTTYVAPPAVTPTTAQLAAYAEAKQIALRDGGITVNVGTTSAPQLVDAATDDRGTSLVTAKVQMISLAAQAGQPVTTFDWTNDDMTSVVLSAAQVQTIGLAIPTYHEATYAALRTVNTAIGNGTITTYPGIDTASWPSTTV